MRQAVRNPLVWLLLVVLVAVEPAAVFGLGGLAAYVAGWAWAAGVADRYPPGAPERARAGRIVLALTIGGLLTLLVVAFIIGEHRLDAYGY